MYRVTDGNRTFLKWLVGGSYVRYGGEPAVVGFAIQCHSVAMEQWTVEHRMFAYDGMCKMVSLSQQCSGFFAFISTLDAGTQFPAAMRYSGRFTV